MESEYQGSIPNSIVSSPIFNLMFNYEEALYFLHVPRCLFYKMKVNDLTLFFKPRDPNMYFKSCLVSMWPQTEVACLAGYEDSRQMTAT